VFPGNLHFDSWRRLGRQTDLITDSSAWWLGDWLVYGEKRYPDRYQRAQGGDWTRSRLRREIRLAQSGPELGAGPGSPPGDRPSVLALPIDPDQRERWQLTAERIGLSVVEWITELVDRETARLADGLP
jgi:hypothetical protein